MLMERLHEADRRKDEFLAMLSHELRNPLAAISSALEVIRHPSRSEPDAQLALERIERQNRVLKRLIDDLLDVNRIAHDKLELSRQPVDLSEAVSAAVESCPLLEDRRLSIRMPETPVLLEADAARLTQALLNLLSNAAKFTPPGGEVSLSAEREGPWLLLRVRDTGVGIAPDVLPRVFELFYQADHTLERTQGGLGVGLPLARRLIELHGGSIEAHSAGPGRGSEFVVRLPVAEGGLAAPAEPARDSAAPAPPKRILVADDNADSAESLALLLQLAGHEVEIAHDGEEALAKAERFKPNVALLDIGMPRLNGRDAARRLRARPWAKGLLLIAATGWAQAEERRRTQEAGFDAHLVKPVDRAALLKLLSDSGKPPG
jgi:CheY-like chemotaxis protein